MEFVSITQAKRMTGISYLGAVNYTTKHEKAWNFNEMVYCLYLAPATLSGYNTCAGSTHECVQLCLNKSGKNIGEMNDNMIDKSRIKKTKLFYEHREFFMRWLVEEIKKHEKKAIKMGYTFSVRLNNTSDISPETFKLNGKNILQLFPHIQFYDYTKIFNRIKLMDKYSNYDITYSYSGENVKECEKALKENVRVAVVFRSKVLPTVFMGREVVDGDKMDMRYRDPKGCIVGLKFKVVKNRIPENSKFVVTV